jgi:DNA repair exonuclease SbcCD nuclease subunit
LGRRKYIMTRFLYIADTHVGATRTGYQQQKGCPEKLPQILSALCEYLSSSGGVDFILHGGDMLDSATEDNIVAAANAFHLLPHPVYLCLGNHDLTTPDAVDLWLELAPQFFIGGATDYTVASEDCVIHVAPNQWGDVPFYWDRTQRPHLSPAQMEHLKRELSMGSDLPHIILTHSPVHGLPVEQTGFPEPYHCPDASFTAEIMTLAERHANIRCILGAHNHLNMRIDHGGVEFATVSSMVETPFEFKLFEVTPRRIEMTTFGLSSALDFDLAYDFGKSFVQGREVDRSFTREFESSRIST